MALSTETNKVFSKKKRKMKALLLYSKQSLEKCEKCLWEPFPSIHSSIWETQNESLGLFPCCGSSDRLLTLLSLIASAVKQGYLETPVLGQWNVMEEWICFQRCTSHTGKLGLSEKGKNACSERAAALCSSVPAVVLPFLPWLCC